MNDSEKVPATEIAKRAWSEGIWMYLFHDSSLERGKKHVLVVLAPDRTHPEFKAMFDNFSAVEKELDESYDLKVFFEDHPAGYLHEKFETPPQEFRWYLIDIHGDRIAQDQSAVSVSGVLDQLKGYKANTHATPL